MILHMKPYKRQEFIFYIGNKLGKEKLTLPWDNKKKIDFLIVGSLCNNDLLIAYALLKMNFDIKIIRHEHEIQSVDTKLLEKFNLNKIHIITYQNKLQFIKNCMQAKVIISIAGSLVFYLGKAIYLIYTKALPPILSYTTGSDIMEQPFTKNIVGHRYRVLFKNSFDVCIVPMKEYIYSCQRLKLSRFSFVRHPYLLLKPKFQNKINTKKKKIITFLHTSNIDWGAVDSCPNRKSTKGTNKFINAFIKASRAYPNIKCLIIDRGPDTAEAKKIIEKNNRNNVFEWMKPVVQSELEQVFDRGDIVVDQFVLGGFGGIAIEAMSYGKPLLTYIDPLYSKGLFYNDAPPVFNANTEEEILNQISFIAENPELLNKRSKDCVDWIDRNYNNKFNFVDIFIKLDSVYGYNFSDKIRGQCDK